MFSVFLYAALAFSNLHIACSVPQAPPIIKLKNINKNMNIIKVDAKAVAVELMKILQPYLKGRRRGFGGDETGLINDLETAVYPVFEDPSRRFSSILTFANVASSLDQITKQSLLLDPRNDEMSVEILTRKLVANMLIVIRENVANNGVYEEAPGPAYEPYYGRRFLRLDPPTVHNC